MRKRGKNTIVEGWKSRDMALKLIEEYRTDG